MGREWPETIKTEWIGEQEVRDSGLLAYINRSLLWPLGLALTVFIEKDGSYREGMRIFKNVPFDPIASEEPIEHGGTQCVVALPSSAAWRVARPPSRTE
jgi:hypothetical protein